MCIVTAPVSTCLLGTHQANTEDERGDKGAAWEKHSDMIHFMDLQSDEEFLQIIVEIGVSGSYDDLVRDTSQWLLRSVDGVKLVIITKIEDKEVSSTSIRQRSSLHALAISLLPNTKMRCPKRSTTSKVPQRGFRIPRLICTRQSGLKSVCLTELAPSLSIWKVGS